MTYGRLITDDFIPISYVLSGDDRTCPYYLNNQHVSVILSYRNQ